MTTAWLGGGEEFGSAPAPQPVSRNPKQRRRTKDEKMRWENFANEQKKTKKDERAIGNVAGSRMFNFLYREASNAYCPTAWNDGSDFSSQFNPSAIKLIVYCDRPTVLRFMLS
jgi:hypothetical protein